MSDKYLPINLSLKGRACLVVGGGQVALRKIDNLIDYKADITVIAPKVDEKIKYYHERGMIKLEQREYKESDSTVFGLVIAASDADYVNKQIYDECHKIGIPVNVVDNPPLCDFTFPATLRRNHLAVAISTDGTAPFLASHLKVIMENIFPKHWEKISEYAAEFRDEMMKKWPEDQAMKNECIDRFLSADWKTIMKDNDEDQIKKMLSEMLEKA